MIIAKLRDAIDTVLHHLLVQGGTNIPKRSENGSLVFDYTK